MSERSGDRRGPREPGDRGTLALLWAAAAVFLAMLALLAVRVGSGQDPALRARVRTTALPPRRVLVRRIYERRVIVHLPASVPTPPTSASQQITAAGFSAPSPLVTRTS